MALKRTFLIGALLVSLITAGSALGQNNIPSAKFERMPDGAANRPFASPGLFDYDAQVFAPLEFTNGKEKDPNTGFYFSLDRVYTSITRGARFSGTNLQFESPGSEFAWGTRYEGGWFGEDQAGWNIVYQDVKQSTFHNGNDSLVSNPMVMDSKITSFELNRIFRQELSSGGYFEPYLGIRYNGISDESLEDTTRGVLQDLDNDGIPETVVDTPNRFLQKATNSAFGLQAGGRYNVRRGRWRFTGDGAIATTYNQQRYFASDITTSQGTINITESHFSDQSFVPVLDGQFEMAYNVSRDLSLKLGVQATYIWDGVTRVNTETTNLNGNSIFGVGPAVQPFDENFVSTGFIFGVEWRR